jgi:thioredoxin-related protein
MRLLILALLSFISVTCFSQKDSLKAPYLRFPDLPPINLLLSDSTSRYTRDDIPKKTPVLLMLFSPECSHCQHTAEEIMKYRNELKDIHIVMATMHPLSLMREFTKKYKLDSLPNVTVGEDIYYFMASFYAIKNLPFMAFYNKQGKLISVFEGSMPIPKVVELFKENK